MAHDPSPSAGRARELPSRPNLEHLKREAKQRLKVLRRENPRTRLAVAQLTLAREYGFASWRQLKAHVDKAVFDIDPATDRKQVFDAARAGDVAVVRRAFEAGFDPASADADGRTIHQIGKQQGHTAIELVARQFQERAQRAPADQQVVDAILDAAERGRRDDLRRLLDERPDLVSARGGNFQQQTALHKAAWRNRQDCAALLLERGADVNMRDYGDNASALHFAAEAADLEVVHMLVEAGADIIGAGDDHQLGVLGWATSLRSVREDIANYLIGKGAPLTLWSAIALDRAEDVRALVMRDPGLLNARMSRNEHHRTPLHHAAARNRPRIVRLLLDLGAAPNAQDAIGATPLTTAAHENGDAEIIAMLQDAGAQLDFAAALGLARYDLAAAMLADDPARIGPDGRDTVALHLAVARQSASSVRWLLDHGADVNAKRRLWDCNLTPLHLTAETGAIEIARMLLARGANPDIRDDKYGATVLGWAEFCGQPQLAQLLREHGAS